MGCDIHLIVQVFNGHRWVTRDDDGLEYDERNYQMFSILADVRGDLTPIAPPKGLPEGLVFDKDTYYGGDSDTVDGNWLGEHSASWHTLLDLINFDWDQSHESEGYIAASAYEEWAKTRERPKQYCAGSSGTLYTEEEFLATDMSYEGKDWACKQMVKVTWVTSYKECAGYFYDVFYENLLELCHKESILWKDVRIVFGFDS